VQLQDQTKTFLEVLLFTVFQTVNKRHGSSVDDGEIITDIFGKAKDEQQLAVGLRYFLSDVVRSTSLVTSSSAKRDLQRGIKVAISALTNLDILPV
jgi:hypothetical protein